MENVITETRLSFFNKKINAMRRLLLREIALLRSEVKNLPDNPNIERIGKNMFIMNSSQLRTESWSPFTYDFGKQYEKITEVIKETAPEKLQDKLNEIHETGTIRMAGCGYGGGYQFVFHPDVLAHLKNLLGVKLEIK